MLSHFLQPGSVCTSHITPHTFLRHAYVLFRGFETLDKALSSVQLVQSYTLVHAQRPGTTVPQTPTYWTVTIGLVDGYNGLEALPVHIDNFQANSPKDLS